MRKYEIKLRHKTELFISNQNLQQIENEGQENESKSDPLGHLGELCVHGLGLSLEGVAVIAAADGAADAAALTGLEHDDSNESETCDELNDGEYDFEDLHFVSSFQCQMGIRPHLSIVTADMITQSKTDFKCFFAFLRKLCNNILILSAESNIYDGYCSFTSSATGSTWWVLGNISTAVASTAR